MKRAYGKSKYAKPCEQYCRGVYPGEAETIFEKAEAHYLAFMKDMPDLGENMMAKNMLDWFTILAFYEASGRRMDGEVLLTIKRRAVDRLKFLGKFIDGNKQQWPYRLFERTYRNIIRMQEEHQAKGGVDGQLEDRAQPRSPDGGLLLPSHRMSHRQARQGPRLRAAAAVPVQNRPLSG